MKRVKKLNLNIGDKFGKWTIIANAQKSKFGFTSYFCECLCGTKRNIEATFLKNKKTHGCTKCKKVTHGESKKNQESKLYKRWERIRDRCNNKNNPFYEFYGGRGIKICERWNSYIYFKEDMGDIPFPNASIDRINVNGNYEPSNCRWATPKEQANNKRNNHVIEAFGKKQTLTQWAEEYGISISYLRTKIIRLKLHPEKALITRKKIKNKIELQSLK